MTELISERVETPSLQHMTGKMIRNKIGKNYWKSCFRFTIVRHPYTRMMSEYNWGYSAIQCDDFLQFLRRVQRIVNKNLCYAKYKYDHFLPQHKYLNGIKVHHIGRFENFEDTIKIIESKFGRKVTRVKDQQSKRKKKKTTLTQQEKDLIYAIYKKDFEIFNYER